MIPILGDEEFGQKMIEMNLVRKEDLERARSYQRTIGGSLGNILHKLGIVRDEDLARAVASVYHLPQIDMSTLVINRKLIASFPRKRMEQALFFPIDAREGTLTIAMVDPSDVSVIDEVTFENNGQVQIRVVSISQAEKIISDFLYRNRLPNEGGVAMDAVWEEKLQALPSDRVVKVLVKLLAERGVVTCREIVERAGEA
ncbi:MAG: hypothetical protein V1809_02560 [Planctomycetota bacterium]